MTEETLNTNVPEVEATTEPAVEEKEVEAKSYSQEELDKAIQSAASKAKWEILKALDLKSVDAYKEKINEYENMIKEYDDLKKSNETYASQIEDLNRNLVLEKMGVSEDFRDDLVTLAKAKVSNDKTFEQAVAEVLDKNPAWKTVGQPAVKLGVEKAEISQDDEVTLKLKQRYPWIK